MNLESVELDNGLTIYLLNDNTKHVSLANLIVNFGGIDDSYLINGRKKHIKSGTAHFLEHVVLESSKYGDLMKLFGNSGIRSNGLTSIERTEFFIDTVDNFYDNLGLLIKGIHSPIFNKKRIDDIRKPILEEKRRSLDNKLANLYNANLSTYLNNKKFKSVLGDMSDIKSININDLECVFKAFYRPSNEMLVVSGNFDKKRVIDVIKDAYNEIEFDSNIFNRIKEINKDRVNKKRLVIKDNTNIGRSVINFKISVNNLSGYEKIILDTYIFAFLKMNFGVTSKLNKELLKNNIIVGNIIYSCNIIDGYIIISVEANTNKYKEFENIILEYFKTKSFIYDEELFNLFKKRYIIDIVLRNDSIYSMLEPFIQNLIFFKYEGIDKVCDIENMTFKEYKDKIEGIDFSNYSIAELRPKN